MKDKAKIRMLESSHLDEMIAELEEAVSRCGPKLYRITRDGGVAYIYHHYLRTIVIWPESVLTENNLVLSNELSRLLMEFSKEYPLVTTTLTWEENNRNSADAFFEWIAENHPEVEPFEAEYIGPEMKDTRTKFGRHLNEDGEVVIYN